MDSKDLDINQGVRQVLSRNWYDLTKTNFASRQGIVRMIGELQKLGREAELNQEPAQIENLKTELQRLKGVRQVHFDFANWRRNEDGEWVPVEPDRRDVQSDRGAGADLGHGEIHTDE